MLPRFGRARLANARRPLADGRDVRLTQVYQYGTYSGVLCGVPDTDEVRAWPIEGAVRMADNLFQCAGFLR